MATPRQTSPSRQSDHRCQGGRGQRRHWRHERRAGLHRLDGSITRYTLRAMTPPFPPTPATPSLRTPPLRAAALRAPLCRSRFFPGLVVTDKDGQRISYTSIRGNNVLSLSVGRFTASLHASLAALRQLRLRASTPSPSRPSSAPPPSRWTNCWPWAARIPKSFSPTTSVLPCSRWAAKPCKAPLFPDDFCGTLGTEICKNRGKVTYGWRPSYSFHLF